MSDLLFYTFTFLTLACAALVVVNKNAVNAAMFLIVSLVGVAGLFVLLDAALLVVGVLSLYHRAEFPAAVVPAAAPTLKAYAEQLFTTYLLPVQVVGFMLLIAMLGVIVLSKKFAVPEDAP